MFRLGITQKAAHRIRGITLGFTPTGRWRTRPTRNLRVGRGTRTSQRRMRCLRLRVTQRTFGARSSACSDSARAEIVGTARQPCRTRTRLVLRIPSRTISRICSITSCSCHRTLEISARPPASGSPSGSSLSAIKKGPIHPFGSDSQTRMLIHQIRASS